MPLKKEIKISAQRVIDKSRSSSKTLQASPSIAAIGDTLRRLNSDELDVSRVLFDDLLAVSRMLNNDCHILRKIERPFHQ